MKAHRIEKELTYTGEQLRSLWIYRTFGLQGDAIVWFAGPCDVSGEHLVDQVDAAANDYIRAACMIHFIVEQFEGDLTHAILRQRLLVCLAAGILHPEVEALRRVGDDLWVGERKLSVSIATVSPVSTLIHFAVNIDPTGAPVPAIGLGELGVDPWRFADRLATAYVEETELILKTRCTVRGVC
ncbi:MAG: DUF366 family protein [Candidatus Zipacnadales bacterium]